MGYFSMRIDIITGCKPGFKVYRTWPQVIKAIQRGETIIKTSRVNRTKDTYNLDGTCKTVGCYNNQLCRLLRNIGITDIRYGSRSYWLPEGGDTYTLYL